MDYEQFKKVTEGKEEEGGDEYPLSLYLFSEETNAKEK